MRLLITNIYIRDAYMRFSMSNNTSNDAIYSESLYHVCLKSNS